MARRYRRDLEAADLRFRKNRFFEDGIAAPLSRKQRNDRRLLRWLYPPHAGNGDPEAEARADAALSSGHPFYDEEPAADGNFYPCEFIEFAHVPRYCILITGQPPIFSDEEPIGWSNYKPTAEPTPPST